MTLPPHWSAGAAHRHLMEEQRWEQAMHRMRAEWEQLPPAARLPDRAAARQQARDLAIAAMRRLHTDAQVAHRARATAQVVQDARRHPRATEADLRMLEDDALIAALAFVVAEQLDVGNEALAEAWQRGLTAGAGWVARSGSARALPPNPYLQAATDPPAEEQL